MTEHGTAAKTAIPTIQPVWVEGRSPHRSINDRAVGVEGGQDRTPGVSGRPRRRGRRGGSPVVVGNGHLPTREVTTGRGGGGDRTSSPRPRPDQVDTPVILPRYMRRSPKVTEVLPVLYLRGLSTGDFAPALEVFFGCDAGLSASTIQRPTEAWQQVTRRMGPPGPVRGRLRVLVGGWDLAQRPSSRCRR